MFSVTFSPKTQDQRRAVHTCLKHDLTFLLGPAGCGKTHVALATALGDMRTSKRSQLIVTHPMVECGTKLGYMPGDVNEKIQRWRRNLDQELAKMVLNRDLPRGMVQFVPTSDLRGCTFDDAWVYVEEAQNYRYGELKMILTRLGSNSKLIVAGDPDQSDLTGPDDPCDLDTVVDRLEGKPGIGLVEFDEHVTLRHPVVSQVLRCL